VRAVNPLTLTCDAFKTAAPVAAGTGFVRRFTAPTITMKPGFIASANDPSGAIRAFKAVPSTAPCMQPLRVAGPITNVKQTEVAETPPLDNIVIYPSPSMGLVKLASSELELAGALITVLDQSGRLVHQTTNNANTNLVELNLQHLANGVYFVKIRSKNKVVTQKILISK
jgi:hypothetical protein